MLSLSDCGVVAQIERLTKLPLVIPTRPSLQETRDYCFHSFRFPLISVPRTQPLSKLHQVDNIVLQSTCSDWTIFSLGLAEQYCIVRQSCNLLDCQTGSRAEGCRYNQPFTWYNVLHCKGTKCGGAICQHYESKGGARARLNRWKSTSLSSAKNTHVDPLHKMWHTVEGEAAWSQ